MFNLATHCEAHKSKPPINSESHLGNTNSFLLSSNVQSNSFWSYLKECFDSLGNISFFVLLPR